MTQHKTYYGKIAVFAGGESSERAISLKSGRAVWEALKKEKQDVDFIDVSGDVKRLLLSIRANIVFIAMHGRFGEDGTVQRLLEELGMTYTGSGVEASRLAMDKVASRRIFSAHNIPVPKYKAIRKEDIPKNAVKDMHTPFVVKPQSEGSSIGLTIIKHGSQIEDALDKAFQYGDTIVLEEYIEGRELTVGILGDRALPVIEIKAKDTVYDYDAKYEDKSTEYIVPADLKQKEHRMAQELATRAHHTLGCRDFSRVDMRLDTDGNIIVLEVNTIPGMTERSLLPKAANAAGIDFRGLCMKLVDMAYRRGIKDGKNQREQESEETKERA